MATTGFWPVKDRLKEVIDYAENPDKTIDQKYMDKDLYAALQYVSNDKKTDKQMYVSGINCNAKRAYERMTATKKRFGKMDGNVAYHGYQSFITGEVTPPKKHTKSDWKPQGVCGVQIMKSLLPPTSIPIIFTITLLSILYPLRRVENLKIISPTITNSEKSLTPFVWNTAKAY